ncbi:uncharacterized protein DEA37_0006830 [Paragonimus westermani]|uniref:Uncharacterized protein n=1 Tax=Paragonimus westermani TaxID=34504 RepID=A0A5J4NNB7_9TREM|nr:uncharacterized protein DEA37_0006830 [Paragonimus westermani]
MGPCILSFFNEEEAKMFRRTDVRLTNPAPVVLETLHQLFEKIGTPGGLSGKVLQPPSGTGPVDCERKICKRFCMGFRKRDLQTKFISKPALNLSTALIRAKECEDLEQLEKKLAAKDSVCSDFRQNSLNPGHLLRPNRPGVLMGGECCYCKRLCRRARHCGYNPQTGSQSPKGESLTLYVALYFVISPNCVVNLKPSSVRGNINKEPVLFSVNTGASSSLINPPLADELKEHRTAPAKPVRYFSRTVPKCRWRHPYPQVCSSVIKWRAPVPGIYSGEPL